MDNPEAALERDRKRREAHPYDSEQRRQEYLRRKAINAGTLEQQRQQRELVQAQKREQRRAALQLAKEERLRLREQKRAATLASPCIACGKVDRYSDGACRPCSQETNRRWAQENPGMVLARLARRRAREAQALRDAGEVDPLIAHFYHRAHKLNAGGITVHVDHIVPLSNGGPHSIHNLRIVSADENVAKGAKVPSVEDLEPT